MNNKQTLQQHITYKNELLPYSYNEITVVNGQPDVLYHWHSECEFIYVHEGTGRFHIEDDIFHSQAGDIILIHPNALHSIHPLNNASHRFTVFNVHLDLIGASVNDYSGIRYLQPLQNGFGAFTPVIRHTDANYEQIKTLLFLIFYYAKENIPFHSFLLKAKVNELFYHLYNSQYAHPKALQQNAYRKEERIRKTIDFINHHYADHLTIDTLANVCGYSPSHFMAFFKQNVGVNANDYLVQKRLKVASELLESSTDTIVSIALQTGFNNLSNFNRQFKRYYQCTPSHYRKQFVVKH